MFLCRALLRHHTNDITSISGSCHRNVSRTTVVLSPGLLLAELSMAIWGDAREDPVDRRSITVSPVRVEEVASPSDDPIEPPELSERLRIDSSGMFNSLLSRFSS